MTRKKEIEEKHKIISEMKTKLQGVHFMYAENIIKNIEKKAKPVKTTKMR